VAKVVAVAEHKQVEQTTSNLPEYARPYFEELLGRTAYESTRPYEAYPGQRIADFTPYEQMGMQGMYNMAAQGAPAQARYGIRYCGTDWLSAIQYGNADSKLGFSHSKFSLTMTPVNFKQGSKLGRYLLSIRQTSITHS
jgi:hypothetical protein